MQFISKQVTRDLNGSLTKMTTCRVAYVDACKTVTNNHAFLTLENVLAYYRQLIAWVPDNFAFACMPFYLQQYNNKSLPGLIIK